MSGHPTPTLWQSLLGGRRGPAHTATEHPQQRPGPSSSAHRLQHHLSSLSSQEARAQQRLYDLVPRLTAERQAELLRLECEHTANFIWLLRARAELARAREAAAADNIGHVDTRNSSDQPLLSHAPGGQPAQTSAAASPFSSAACSSSGLPSVVGQGADQVVRQAEGWSEGIVALSRRVSELSSRTSALLAQVEAARRRAAALRQPSVREETLRDLLARARLAFDGGERLRLYAPMAELQRRFEVVVCAPGAREARLFSSWIRRIAPPGHFAAPATLDAAVTGVTTMGLCGVGSCEADNKRVDSGCRFRLSESACYLSPSERRFGNADRAEGAEHACGMSCAATGHHFPCSQIDSGSPAPPPERGSSHLVSPSPSLSPLLSPSRSSVSTAVAPSASLWSLHLSPSASSLLAAASPFPTGVLTPCTFLDFISYFARLIAKTYHLDEAVPAAARASSTAEAAPVRPALLPPLEQCAARLVFSSAFPVLFPPIHAECASKDAALLRQQRWMRMLPDAAIAGEQREDAPTSSQVSSSDGAGNGNDSNIGRTAESGDSARAIEAYAGAAITDAAATDGPATPNVSPPAAAHPPGSPNPLAHFTTRGDAAFGLAVGALAELSFATVPADALLCLMRTVRHLHESAAEATGIPVEAIGADVLQPLLVLAAVRADLPFSFSMLTFTSRYSSPEVAKFEPGYYLACLEAALEYILSVTPAELGADASVVAVAEASRIEVLQAMDTEFERTPHQGRDSEAEGAAPKAGCAGSGNGDSLLLHDGSGIAQQPQASPESAEIGFVPPSTTAASMASGIGATAGTWSSSAAASSEAVHARRELLDFLQHERDLSDLLDSLAL